MDVISERIRLAEPEHYRDLSAIVVPVAGEIVGPYERLLFTLLGAVGLVLLIACVNVANLMLARAMERGPELAVRSALGAGRTRLMRQLLTESLLLAAIGGALGLLVATLSLRPVLALLPVERSIPRMHEIQLDWQVLGFTLALSLVTGLLFGLAPAWRASRASLNDALKEGGRGFGSARHARRFGNLLVAAEVGLSLFLLVGAGLLLRSFWLLHQVDSGFDTERVLTANITLPAHRYGQYEVGGPNPQRASLYRELERQLSELPGVTSAAVSSLLPMKHGPNPWGITIEGRGAPPNAAREGIVASNPAGRHHHGSISIERVTPGYFRTFGVSLVRGRYLDERDAAGGPLVTLINETLARRFFPDEDPIGRRITVDMTSYFPKMTIVGIVADNKMHGLDREPYPLLYWSITQYPSINASVAVRTQGDPAAIARAVQEKLRSIDSDVAIRDVTTMRAIVSNSLWRQRFTTFLIGLFAGLAFVLATAGIYAVISYSVSQRTQEMGLRITLGAGPQEIVRLVVGHGLKLCLTGVGAGLIASLAAQRLLANQLFGVSPNDPLTISVVSLLLILVGALASYLPARRALRVDPATALRSI
jgi:predicted permease